jgi:hypothetical protein
MKIFGEKDNIDLTKKGILFPLEVPNTCGIAVSRTILYNNHDITTLEETLIEIAGGPKIKTKHSYKPKYDILGDGTDLPSLELIAKEHDLEVFSESNGKLEHLKSFLDMNLWPIIHRPFELDGDGHYVLVYGFNGRIQIFDPSPVKTGQVKEESYDHFYDKWYYKDTDERWFGVFYDPKKLSKQSLNEIL